MKSAARAGPPAAQRAAPGDCQQSPNTARALPATRVQCITAARNPRQLCLLMMPTSWLSESRRLSLAQRLGYHVAFKLVALGPRIPAPVPSKSLARVLAGPGLPLSQTQTLLRNSSASWCPAVWPAARPVDFKLKFHPVNL